MYYLQSRYYDPETGRFLNADDVGFIGYSGEQLSYNAFAYCENNAINVVDYSGCNPLNVIKLVNAVLKMLRSFKNTSYYIQLCSYIEIEQDPRTNNTKGIIRVDFTKIEAEEWKTLKRKYKTLIKDLTDIALYRFEEEFKRSFLFDRDCVENEIAQHLDGYINATKNAWWAYSMKFNFAYVYLDYSVNKNFKDINFNTIVPRVKSACNSADIYEADVSFNKLEACGFFYFYHIHPDYTKNKDPYYNRTTKKRDKENNMEDWLYESL